MHGIPGWMTRLQVSTQPTEKFAQFTQVTLYARITRKARSFLLHMELFPYLAQQPQLQRWDAGFG
jgi:hypothetical protein